MRYEQRPEGNWVGYCDKCGHLVVSSPSNHWAQLAGDVHSQNCKGVDPDK